MPSQTIQKEQEVKYLIIATINNSRKAEEGRVMDKRMRLPQFSGEKPSNRQCSIPHNFF